MVSQRQRIYLMKMDKNTVQQAIHEIRELRRRNELLSAQVYVIDVFAAALLPQRSQGAAPDIVWQLQHELDTIDEAS
jgi:hypothetical protein